MRAEDESPMLGVEYYRWECLAGAQPEEPTECA